MHHSFIDRYSDLRSPIHAADARIKIIIALTALICVISVPQSLFPILIAYAALILLCSYCASLPFIHLIKRLLITLPFIALIAVGMLFSNYGESALLRYLLIMAKAAIAISILTLLASTTPFPRLLEGLRWFRAPTLLISILAFLYRYIFILMDEGERLSIGRRSRHLSINRSLAWRSRAWMVGTLLVRSLERSERVYRAMLARGFSGNIRALELSKGLSWLQFVISGLVMTGLILMRLIPTL